MCSQACVSARRVSSTFPPQASPRRLRSAGFRGVSHLAWVPARTQPSNPRPVPIISGNERPAGEGWAAILGPSLPNDQLYRLGPHQGGGFSSTRATRSGESVWSGRLAETPPPQASCRGTAAGGRAGVKGPWGQGCRVGLRPRSRGFSGSVSEGLRKDAMQETLVQFLGQEDPLEKG